MTAIAFEAHRNHVTVSYYPTFEAREGAFNDSVGRLVPSRLAGPARFWTDLTEISQRRLTADETARVAFITSNPRDCLAFATPQQVLIAACLRTGIDASAIQGLVRETAEEFGLAVNLYQPLRTLSGGESVKLAMAKAAIAVKSSHRLSVSSPFSWLSAANAGLLTQLLDRYTQRCLPVSIFALEEEDVTEPDPSLGNAAVGFSPVVFSLCLKDVSVRLATAVALATADPPRVQFSDAAFTLPSPCFLTGDNGQGKSLMAKLLAGAMVGDGQINVDGAAGGGRPRMIFQDVVTQMLSRTAEGMLDNVSNDDRTAFGDVYGEIFDACRAGIAGDTGDAMAPSMDDLPEVPTLLDIKLLLAAQRLNSETSLLILDEPDWGLSRRTAAAYVLAVVGAAHRRGIPILVISHKNWWTPLANSRLEVTKEMAGGADNRDGFFVRLIKES